VFAASSFNDFSLLNNDLVSDLLGSKNLDDLDNSLLGDNDLLLQLFDLFDDSWDDLFLQDSLGFNNGSLDLLDDDLSVFLGSNLLFV